MTLLFRLLIAFTLFARDGWSGGPARMPNLSLTDLIRLAIAQIAAVLALGVAMAGLAVLLAMAIKSIA